MMALPWTWYLVRDVDARLDAVALLWPVIGVIAALCWTAVGLLTWDLRHAAVATSWLLAVVAVVIGPWRPLDTGHPVEAFRVVAANVYGSHTYAPGIRPQLQAEHPDVLVISETSQESAPILGAGYRNAGRSRVRGRDELSDVSVFTDLPMTSGRLPASLRNQRGLRAVIQGPSGPFVLYALHLQKPGITPSSVEVGFRSHRRIIDLLVRAVRKETLPVVVAGDLNLADRTSGYRALTNVLDDGMRAGWVGPTSLKRQTRLLLARIDHIFVPDNWCSAASETFTLRGSDHRGVATTVGRCSG